MSYRQPLYKESEFLTPISPGTMQWLVARCQMPLEIHYPKETSAWLQNPEGRGWGILSFLFRYWTSPLQMNEASIFAQPRHSFWQVFRENIAELNTGAGTKAPETSFVLYSGEILRSVSTLQLFSLFPALRWTQFSTVSQVFEETAAQQVLWFQTR